MGPSALAALATIDRLGPITPGELAGIEAVQPPTATRIVARLLEQELVRRSPDPADGRSSLISCTPAGKALLSGLRSRKDAYLARRLGELGERDLATLRRAAALLERMLEEERS